jgi:hypothetical protein
MHAQNKCVVPTRISGILQLISGILQLISGILQLISGILQITKRFNYMHIETNTIWASNNRRLNQ